MRHARLALKHVAYFRASSLSCIRGVNLAVKSKPNWTAPWMNRLSSHVQGWGGVSGQGTFHSCMCQKDVAKAAAVPSGDTVEETDVFYSNYRFKDVVEDPEVSGLLEKAGFSQMSLAQQASYEAIRRGESVVLAAETGSGKTLAYVIPMIDNMVSEREKEGDSGSMLVLCPNAVLCEQVVHVVQSVYGNGPDTYRNIKISYVSAHQMTFEDGHDGFPDIVVTTPGALHSILTGVGPVIGHQWTFEGMRNWARYVVLDEADMLLGGAYGKQIHHLLDELRGGDRERAALKACEELGIRLDEYWGLPRHIRKAAQLHGSHGMIDAGMREHIDHDGELMASKVWLRQYAFVGATMPTNGRETVGAKVAAEYPTATWISGSQLHKTMKQVEFRWVEVQQSKHDSLIEIIQGDHAMSSGIGRMIVFTKDSNSSRILSMQLHDTLEDEGAMVLPYHKSMRQEERHQALELLRSKSNHENDNRSLILVCTDANGRGLDIPGVSHVVHADFPASAVDFLHRSGRTGRAGQGGIVTSLVDDDSRDLADAIKELMDEDGCIEGAFSRNRSFRKKFKKYGKFVKRGDLPDEV